MGILFLLSMTGCNTIISKNEVHEEMEFGKSFNITIGESETIDDQYLQKVLDSTIVKDVPYFDMLGNEQLKTMISYMSANNLVIAPGTYTINQSWKFKDGLFETGNGQSQEIFKFKTKLNK